MKHQLTLLFSAITLLASAQKREEILDLNFKPVSEGGYYYAVTQKVGPLWKREVWLLSKKAPYMDGWYQDEACKIAHGENRWYHTNGFLRSKVHYVNGKKEGLYLSYSDQGALQDSMYYAEGRRKGIGIRRNSQGLMSDSTFFDGNGNGIEVRWHANGKVAASGAWMQDTLKQGQWKYYHGNGILLATEDYDANGKLIVCNCYDEAGTQLDTAVCAEQEAAVDKMAWRRFLETNLESVVKQKAREGITGTFMVMIRFLVEKDGSLSDITPLTTYGHGIEEAVVRIFKKAPKWKPGSIHGRKVRSYHSQPVTFVIQ